MPMDPHGIPLATAISALREELSKAIAQGDRSALRFEATTVELTLQTTVSWSGDAHAGIRWWLIEAGGKLSRESEAVQTVVLHLTPRQADEIGQFRESALIDAADS
jgi:hypothetical protein